MPGPINPEMIQAMVQRELARNPAALEQPKPFDLGLSHGMGAPNAISPELAATIGGVVDTVGTYAGLRRGHGEDNATLSGMSPAKVAMSLLAQLGGQKALTGLLRKFAPKAADAIAANQGAEQIGLAGDWAERLQGQPQAHTGYQRFRDAGLRNQVEQQRRK